MKKVVILIFILLSLVGCSKQTGEEPLTATKGSDYEESDNKYSPTLEAEITQGGQNESYLDSIVLSETPYSIFSHGAEVVKGDVVVIGSYSHGEKNYGGYPELPIQWIVLDKNNEEALLVSLYSVDTEPFFERDTGTMDSSESISWENSTLRKWLNDVYMQSAFTKTEQDCIKQVEVSTPGNSMYGTSGGNVTRDHLFLLSEEEVKHYFETEEKRITYTVPKVEQGDSMYTFSVPDNYFDGWWLRTSGKDTESAVYVNQEGEIVLDGTYVESRCVAVRPAMWVDLTKVRQLSETMNDVTFLDRDVNNSSYKSEEEYKNALNALWELKEGEKSEATIKAIGLSLEDVTENHLYDNSSSVLPFSAEDVEKIREIGEQWGGGERKSVAQQRTNFTLFQYNGSLHTQLKIIEEYWEIPRKENRYIPRSFRIEGIAGTNQICEVEWQGYVKNETEKAELLSMVNCVAELLGNEVKIGLEKDSFDYTGEGIHISVSENSLLRDDEQGKYYYVRISRFQI